jgi:hypothetical protein
MRLEFLAAGLMSFNDDMGPKTSFGLDTLAEQLGDGAMIAVPPGGRALKFLARLVSRPLAKSRATRIVRYLASTDHKIADFIKNGI